MTAQPAFYDISLPNLAPSPTNPRKTFDETDLADLAASIREQGVMQPILVRPWPDEYDTPEGREERPLYEIVAGERRYRASILAGLADIPALVRPLTTRQVLEAQIVENLQRRDVSELEEAEGYDLMMREHGYSADELATKVGKSKAYIYARLKLTALCAAGRQAFRDGLLDASRALLVARIPGAKLQAQAVHEITKGWDGVMSYRRAADHIQSRYMKGLRHAVFSLDDAILCPDAGPCTTCAKRPCNTPELFPDIDPARAADVCTDPDCLAAKTDAHVQRQAEQAAAAGREIVRGVTWGDFHTSYYQLDEEDDEQLATIPMDEDGNDLPPEQAEGADDHRPPTVAEMLQRAGTQLEIVMVEHPSTRVLVECVREADYRNVVPSSRAAESPAPVRVDDTEARKAEGARRQAIYKAIRARAAEEVPEFTALDLRIIARQFWARSWNTARETATKLNGIPEAGLAIADWIEAATFRQLRLLLLDLALEPTTDVPYYGDFSTPAPLLEMAASLGIDPDNPTGPAAARAETASTPTQAAPAADDNAREKTRAELAAKGIKYCHPDHDPAVTHCTWSGRGQKPKWVSDWLENGGTLEELSTANQAAPAADDTPATKAKPKGKGKGATAAKTSKAKTSSSGRASPAERKEKTSSSSDADAPVERCTKTMDLIEATFPELKGVDYGQEVRA